ncbi:PVC-type heme-binding CxxCH protein [Gimesia maris]|uniref:PVC-type heme-binding CxxCH protein n=1 Tax=Gimesia maris TaxID=122 RepID=UPI00241C9018|nr:PVC-type heme-binding CxxCH protein [Gimesia maris]|tara:strand:+ start:27232 stop:29844 length:2613 start_codon:yes stop_codon:yes gene_type:complete
MKYPALCFLVFSSLFANSTLPAAEREPQVKTLQPGVQLTLVAEHAELATPTGVDVDEQGRIWVVATHTHFRPDDYVGPEHDEILIFSDLNKEGRAQKRQVFYNATDATMDLELGPDGWVYLAERDRILRIKDTNGDGKADVEENIAVLKSEADYPHNGLEGLAWDPNGDLVFALGENYAKPWSLTGTDGVTVKGAGEGGVFRCTADGKKLRRIAEGFWNPFGICVRADGEIFAAENDPGERPPCRVLHIIEGGDYGYERSYGSEAHHPFVSWNGELRGTLPMIHPSGEAPCGILPLGRGLLVPSWSDHRIDFYPLTPQGASFTSKPITLVKGSRYFRPSCIAADLASTKQKRVFYLCDWVDGRYQAHGYGRLWKLEIDLNKATWVGKMDLEPPTKQAELAALLRSGKSKHTRKELLQFAQDQDPFLAQSALQALSRNASNWTPQEVATWSAADRIQAVMALKLAKADPEKWVPMFLADKNPDVQFETLRWISDFNLKAFLPLVEAKLSNSDLDYKRFEAAIATWNTLQGKPEAGIRNPELLLAKVQDMNSAPRIRAYALRLLPTQSLSAPKEGNQPVKKFPKGLTLEMLQQLLDVNDETLSLEVVRTLAGNPVAARKILAGIAADAQQSETLRAEAIAGLATLAEQNTDLLLQLSGAKQPAVREEALRALRSITLTPPQQQSLKSLADKYPDSADLLAAALNPKSLSEGRPALTDTNAWIKALETVKEPADPESGRRIFHHGRVANCAHCHRHGGRGNVVGPDLSSLGDKQDRVWLLKSILEPSLEMAPEYQPRTIILNDGRTFTGIRLRSYVKETIRDAHGQNRTFDRSDVEMMVESPISFMPSGLVNSLTDREIKDLLAFLESGASQK